MVSKVTNNLQHLGVLDPSILTNTELPLTTYSILRNIQDTRLLGNNKSDTRVYYSGWHHVTLGTHCITQSDMFLVVPGLCVHMLTSSWYKNPLGANSKLSSCFILIKNPRRVIDSFP